MFVMDIKFLVLLLIVAVSLQESSGAALKLSLGHVKELMNKGLEDNFVEIIKEAQNDADHGFSVYWDTFIELLDLTLKMGTEAKNKIKKLTNEAKDDIQEIRDLASEMDEHVLVCVDNIATRIELLGTESQTKLEGYVGDIVETMTDLVLNAFDLSLDLKKEIAHLEISFNECATVKCKSHVYSSALEFRAGISGQFAELLRELGNNFNDYPKNVARLTNEYSDSIVSLRKEASQCLL